MERAPMPTDMPIDLHVSFSSQGFFSTPFAFIIAFWYRGANMQVKCFPRLRITKRECRSFLLEFDLSLRRATFTSPHRVAPKQIALRVESCRTQTAIATAIRYDFSLMLLQFRWSLGRKLIFASHVPVTHSQREGLRAVRITRCNYADASEI